MEQANKGRRKEQEMEHMVCERSLTVLFVDATPRSELAKEKKRDIEGCRADDQCCGEVRQAPEEEFNKIRPIQTPKS